jgi:acyl-CoA thioesterase
VPDVNAIFELNGEQLVPTRYALSFWGSHRLHGGPVIGLLAHAFESAVDDPEFRVSRITVDLCNPVPSAPLNIRVDRVRESRRILLLQASLLREGDELVRASALFLRKSDNGPTVLDTSIPRGPEELVTTSLFRDVDALDLPPGFHLIIQTRWVPRGAGEPLAIWFHLPMPLISGRSSSALVQAAALSDFGNAVATFDAIERDPNAAAYINADATIYFDRNPVGEWFCLRIDRKSENAGSSIIEVSHFDAQGRFARSLQSRLANSLT